ncbi:hypothetical protein, partial [Streptomyces gilvus]|uniref:hypothetical protein n=1 Tax=Streptomyces gilvus TaxID=2920937 RepID=UPI001F0FBB88
MTLAVAMAGLIATSASAAQVVPHPLKADRTTVRTASFGKQFLPKDISQERCYYLSASNNNHLCVQIITDAFGNWTGVHTTYFKATPGTVKIQLGWAHTDNSPGNASRWVNISGGNAVGIDFMDNPRGCVMGTMNVQGQGHFDTLGGAPSNGVFCS